MKHLTHVKVLLDAIAIINLLYWNIQFVLSWFDDLVIKALR